MSSHTPYQQVREFHLTSGHPVNTEPQFNIFDDEKLINLRKNLIREELDEFRDACVKNHFVEMMDALADTLYVIYGAYLVFGVNFDSEYENQKDKLIVNTSDQLTSVNICNSEPGWITNTNDEFARIYASFENAINKRDFKLMTDELFNLTKSVYIASHHLNINIIDVFTEVHRSNMTKFCINVEQAERSVEKCRLEGRYTSPSYRRCEPVPEYFVIYDSETGKILKSCDFEEPKLQQFINYLF